MKWTKLASMFVERKCSKKKPIFAELYLAENKADDYEHFFSPPESVKFRASQDKKVIISMKKKLQKKCGLDPFMFRIVFKNSIGLHF